MIAQALAFLIALQGAVPGQFDAAREAEVDRLLAAFDPGGVSRVAGLDAGLAGLRLERDLLAPERAFAEEWLNTKSLRGELVELLGAPYVEALAQVGPAASLDPDCRAEGVSVEAILMRAEALEREGLLVLADLSRLEALNLMADVDEPFAMIDLCLERTDRFRQMGPEVHARPVFPALEGAIQARYGQALHAEGFLKEANRSMDEASEKLVRTREWLAFSENERAWVFSSRNKFAKALELFEGLERIARDMGHPSYIAKSISGQAAMFESLGEFETALDHADQHVDFVETHDLRDRAVRALADKCVLLCRMERLDDAAEVGSEVLDMTAGADAGGVDTYHRLRVMFAQGQLDVDECERFIEETDEWRRRRTAMIWLAEHYSAGRPDLAQEWAKKVLSRGETTAQNVFAQIVLGRASAKAGEYRAAVDAMWEAAGMYDVLSERFDSSDLGRLLYVEGRAGDLFGQAARIAIEAWFAEGDQAYAFEALYFMDQGRVRSLREISGRDVASSNYPRHAPDPLGAFLERTPLLDGELLISFDFEAGAAIAVREGGVQPYLLPEPEFIQKRVQFLRLAIDRRDPRLYAEQCWKLTRALLGPVLPWVREARRLSVLSPSGLQQFPIDFLFDQPPQEGPARDFPFIFRHREVVHLPCLRTGSEELCHQYDSMRGFVYSDEGDQLKFAHTEASRLANYFPTQPIWYEGPAASEEQFKSVEHGGVDVLAVVSHGVADREALGSALLLSKTLSEDGYLTVAEIARLVFSYRLVVIAACEAGQGRHFPAEGVVSVGWGVLAAGAEQVLVCSTPIEDRLTYLWMDTFYRQLAATGDPARALRLTRLQLLNRGGVGVRAAMLEFHLWHNVN